MMMTDDIYDDDDYDADDYDQPPYVPPIRGQAEAELMSRITAAMAVNQELKRRTRLLRKTLIELLATAAWRTLGYRSLRAYCKEHIAHCSYSTVIRLKKAMELHAKLEPEADYGAVSACVYRRLSRIPDEDEQQQVWQTAKSLASGAAITSRHIQVAQQMTALMNRDPYVNSPQYQAAKLLHQALAASPLAR
jgi:hypothetical protein